METCDPLAAQIGCVEAWRKRPTKGSEDWEEAVVGAVW